MGLNGNGPGLRIGSNLRAIDKQINPWYNKTMKIIPEQYQCEVCQAKHDTKQGALECEAQTTAEYQIGTLYGDNRKGAHYEGITLCVAENDVRRHQNIGGSWACRDRGNGDSLGSEMCGSSELRLGKHDAHLDQTQPNFKRMVAWLKEQKIPVYIWDGEKSVPFKD